MVSGVTHGVRDAGPREPQSSPSPFTPWGVGEPSWGRSCRRPPVHNRGYIPHASNAGFPQQQAAAAQAAAMMLLTATSLRVGDLGSGLARGSWPHLSRVLFG